MRCEGPLPEIDPDLDYKSHFSLQHHKSHAHIYFSRAWHDVMLQGYFEENFTSAGLLYIL
jgi:hypothetical protein